MSIWTSRPSPAIWGLGFLTRANVICGLNCLRSNLSPHPCNISRVDMTRLSSGGLVSPVSATILPRRLGNRFRAENLKWNDLHVVEGELDPKRYDFPIIPGHQVVGTIESAPENSALEKGQRVGVPWLNVTQKSQCHVPVGGCHPAQLVLPCLQGLEQFLNGLLHTFFNRDTDKDALYPVCIVIGHFHAMCFTCNKPAFAPVY